MSIDAGEEDGFSNGIEKQLTLVKEMTKSDKEDSSMVFQNMLENMWD
jgi:hypothetical protein